VNPADTIEFQAVDVDALRAAHARQQPPERIALPNGHVLESLNAATGTYKVTDMAGRLQGYTHAEHVTYLPTLAEQYLASRDTVPRLQRLEQNHE
jgi:hypothetical protein